MLIGQRGEKQRKKRMTKRVWCPKHDSHQAGIATTMTMTIQKMMLMPPLLPLLWGYLMMLMLLLLR